MHDPPYSPDLTPSDYFLFPWMKNFLKGKHFAHVEELKQKTAEALKGIKVDKFKKLFWAVEKISVGVLKQMESSLKVTEV